MKPAQRLHDLGHSLWLDSITRGLLTSGTLRRYIDDFSVTGLTSNPSIFDLAIKTSGRGVKWKRNCSRRGVRALNFTGVDDDENTENAVPKIFLSSGSARIRRSQICTTKWPCFSITRRFGVDRAGPVERTRRARVREAAESDVRFRESSVLSEPQKRGLTLL